VEARWRSSISLRSALLLHRAPGRILSERLLERVDSEAALQSPGAVGLRAELATPSLNAPVTFSIDSFAVTSPKSRSSAPVCTGPATSAVSRSRPRLRCAVR
jgi:hypothetical protein